MTLQQPRNTTFEFGLKLLAVLMPCVLLAACNPRATLNDKNLLNGARGETYALGHAALCARLPTINAIEKYVRGEIPERSALGRTVKAWDLSGLLNMVQTRDGRWVIMASAGLNNLEDVHFRTNSSGNKDAVCFGRLWIERLIEYRADKPLGFEEGVTARFEVSLKEPGTLKHFRDLKLEPFDPNLFTLTTGTAFGEDLFPTFFVDIPMYPTSLGWILARGQADQN